MPQGHLVVVTDNDILGKVYREKEVILDLSSPFYKGEVMTLEKMKVVLTSAYIVHLTGKKAVQTGIELRLIEPASVLLVEGIPHA